jgi:thiamine kinase-like enzyme
VIDYTSYEEAEEYFVKVFPTPAEGYKAEYIRREIEQSVWAGAKGIAPPVIYFDFQQRLLVTRHLEEEKGEWGECGREPRLSATLATMRRPHQIQVSTKHSRYRHRDVLAFWERQYIKLSQEVNPLPHGGLIRRVLKASTDKLSKRTYRATFLHGDLHQLNVIYNAEKAWIIDWGSRHVGDPMEELAYYASHYHYQLDCRMNQLDMILHKYDASLHLEDAERAKCYLALTHIMAYFWVFRDSSDGSDERMPGKLSMLGELLAEDSDWLACENVSTLRS